MHLTGLRDKGMLYLVSYDIIDNAKRIRLAKKLQDYGQRVQYSVFECSLDAKRCVEMTAKILKLLDPEKDSLRIYQLCAGCCSKISSYGIKKGWEEGDDEKTIVI